MRMLMLLGALASLFIVSLGAATAAGADIHAIDADKLHRSVRSLLLARTGQLTHADVVVVEFAAPTPTLTRSLQQTDDQPDVMDAFSNQSTRGQHIASIRKLLQTHTDELHEPVLEILQRQRRTRRLHEQELHHLDEEQPTQVTMRRFWITSNLFVRGATQQTLETIGRLDHVKTIRMASKGAIRATDQPASPIPRTQASNATNAASTSKLQWGIQAIQAPESWALGINGQNVIVGSMDTGVRASHEALRDNFVEDVGWFDAEGRYDTPHDVHGHGTHTMATAVGQFGIGVAPDARWITCKACRSVDFCPEEDLTACAEFLLCPSSNQTQPQQQHQATGDQDCSSAPHVIINSWYAPRGERWFRRLHAAWLRAGILSVFCIGNEGPNCASAAAPGEFPEVLSVGAIDRNHTVASLSSRGPGTLGSLKPDLVAPGISVRSAWKSGDRMYATMDGTSMATPHVAGVIALMISANPTLELHQVYDILLETAGQTSLQSVAEPSMMCSSNGAGQEQIPFPNQMYGHGFVNAQQAVIRALQATHLATDVSTSSCALHPNVDFIGNDIANVAGDVPEACCVICAKWFQCRAFTWSSFNGGTCWLKSFGSIATGVLTSGVTSALMEPPPAGAVPAKAATSCGL